MNVFGIVPEKNADGVFLDRDPLRLRSGQVPRLPPNFLSDLVVSVNIMRLSSKKTAYVAVFESGVVGNPEFAPNEQPPVEVGGRAGSLGRVLVCASDVGCEELIFVLLGRRCSRRKRCGW